MVALGSTSGHLQLVFMKQEMTTIHLIVHATLVHNLLSESLTWTATVYTDDALWDGEGCGGNEAPRCNHIDRPKEQNQIHCHLC